MLPPSGRRYLPAARPQPPAVGDHLELNLTFGRSGTVQVKVPIEPITYRLGSVLG